MPTILYVMWLLFIGIPVAGIMMSNHRIGKMMRGVNKK